MPNPKKYKTQKEFMAVCVPMTMDEMKKSGKNPDNKQCSAICYSMWRNRDKDKADDKLDATLSSTSLQYVIPLDKEVVQATASLQGNDKSSSGGQDRTPSDRSVMAGAVKSSKAFSSEQKQEQKEQKAMAENTELKQEVEKILAEKDAAKKVEARIAELESKHSASEKAKAQAETEKAKLSDELAAVRAEMTKSTEQAKALSKEKEELAATVARLEGELKGIREEQALAVRKDALAKAGLLLPEGDKQTAQLAKIKVMTDEAFAAYQAELGDIAEATKKAVTPPTKTEAELKAEADKKAEAEKAAAAEKAKKDAEEKAKASEAAQSADLSHGEKYRQAVAAVSATEATDATMVETYARM